MPAAATVRALGVVVLVVTALLGTAFVLGRSLITGPASTPPAGLVASPTSRAPWPGAEPSRADGPATRKPSTTKPSAGNPDAGPDRAATPARTDPPALRPGVSAEQRQLPLEQGGPYGSRLTTGSGQVALTFDDGPDPTWTPQILGLLRRYQVKATFCLVGKNAQRYPDLVRAIAADGHALCNHSWNHDLLLGSRSRQVIEADLLRTNQAIWSALPGARIAYYRQPGGNWTYPVVLVAQELGMTALHWTVDPKDWKRPGAGNIASMVTGSTVPGSVVLLHDAGGDRQGTVVALGTILPNLVRRFQLDALPTGTA